MTLSAGIASKIAQKILIYSLKKSFANSLIHELSDNNGAFYELYL